MQIVGVRVEGKMENGDSLWRPLKKGKAYTVMQVNDLVVADKKKNTLPKKWHPQMGLTTDTWIEF